jgi:hypothetical protein
MAVILAPMPSCVDIPWQDMKFLHHFSKHIKEFINSKLIQCFAHAFSKPVIFFIFKSGWHFQNRFNHDSTTCLPEISFAHCATDEYVMGIPRRPWIFTHFTKIPLGLHWEVVCGHVPPDDFFLLEYTQKYKGQYTNVMYLSSDDQVKIWEHQNHAQLDMQSSVDRCLVWYLMLKS